MGKASTILSTHVCTDRVNSFTMCCASFSSDCCGEHWPMKVQALSKWLKRSPSLVSSTWMCRCSGPGFLKLEQRQWRVHFHCRTQSEKSRTRTVKSEWQRPDADSIWHCSSVDPHRCRHKETNWNEEKQKQKQLPRLWVSLSSYMSLSPPTPPNSHYCYLPAIIQM